MAERENTESTSGGNTGKGGAAAPMRPGMGGPGRGGHGPYMGPKEKPKNTKATLLRLWRYLERRKIGLAVVFFFVLAGSVLTLVGPFLIGRAIDVMVAGPGKIDFARLALIVGELIGAYLLGTVFTWFQIYIMAGLAQGTVRDIRADLFAKLQTLSLRYFDSKTHGELMSRLTNDVENINTTLTMSTTQLFSSLVMVLGSVGMMLVLSPLLTVLSLIVIPVGIWITSKISSRTRTAFTDQQRELGALNGLIEETVSGERVVKAFRRENGAVAEFDAVNVRLREAGTKAQIYSGIVPPFMNLINNLSYAVVAAAGGALAITGRLTVGVIASFLNYSKQFGRPINEIANQYNMIMSAVAGAERVFEVMNETPDLADAPGAVELANVSGDVEFRNVTFGYKPGSTVLRGVNLHARPGETVALVGPTGAGKTTIVNLLTRFYDIDSGSILVDGHDIRALKRDSLRRSLGIVLQDTYLFSASVRENIRYGRLDATDAEVEEAAKVTEADAFIRRLPLGYDTVLGEDGGTLSQGQRQLLAIARAVLADPAILILDEATSSVDTRTELHIQKAMIALMKGRTSFVIAHRLSTIRDADEILVINRGEIAERGTHESLLAGKGAYADLYNAQLRREAEMRESVALVV
jgi:ATP-binding cassette, subfamily B, multidrug efflux pump